MKTVTVDGLTVPHAYLRRLEVSRQDRACVYKKDGQWISKTWNAVHEEVLGLFRSFQESGLKPGDKVCIASQSRPEWFISDLAILGSGIVTVPIYHSTSVEDITFIIDNCEAKLVFVEDVLQLEKLMSAMKSLRKQLPLVCYQPLLESLPGVTVTPYVEFAKPTSDPVLQEAFRARVMQLAPETTASIVYTSGTTGRPKGAVLTHKNFMAELRAVVNEVVLYKDDLTLAFLPFAHILGRVESLLPVAGGTTLGFAENLNAIAQNIREIKPSCLISVPRIYEKIYAKIQSDVESAPPARKRIFHWAVSIGRKVAQLRSAQRPIPLNLLLKFQVADRLVFSKVRAKMGGRIRFTVSGGAPLSPELCEFFHACGIRVLEGYGLTETTAAIAVNRPDDYMFGTVGRPMPGAEVRIAPDGEIQVRGPYVFKEYYKNPEATKEAFTEDGYFCTGDIGEINSRGFIKITDRKKELIVTSGGKKVAPQKLENMIKTCRFLSHGMVYGDKQKYLVALLTLNEPEVRKWAQEQGVNGGKLTPESLTGLDKINELIEEHIKQINSQLASYESIKRFRILTSDFTVETGELTPSMKLKRKYITEKFKNDIEQLYS